MSTVVLVGQTASGKSTLARCLVKHGFRRVKMYTTREIRISEERYPEYHHISTEAFEERLRAGFFTEYTEYDATFGHVYYGTAKEDLEPTSDDKCVMILNPDGVRALKDARYDIRVVYLRLPETVLWARAMNRGDSIFEISRRINADAVKFFQLEKTGYIDLVLACPKYTPEELADEILKRWG